MTKYATLEKTYHCYNCHAEPTLRECALSQTREHTNLKRYECPRCATMVWYTSDTPATQISGENIAAKYLTPK